MKEPKIVTKPAFTVIGIKLRGKAEDSDYGALWDALVSRMDEIRGATTFYTAYGVEGNMDMSTGEFDYLAGFEVTPDSSVPPGMSHWDIPAQTYAVFPCTLSTIKETWQAASDIWLPQSGWRYGPGPDFELYPETFDPDQPGSEMFIYLPVQ